MRAQDRQCLHCGMLNPFHPVSIHDRDQAPHCIKCDLPLFEQGDGSTLRVDIAHHRETVEQALNKLDHALEDCWLGFENRLRLIVGGGRIHDAVLGQLWYLRNRGTIVDYREEKGNPGAIIVTVRKGL